MYDIEIENKASVDPFMMTSLFLPDMLQTDKDPYFLRLTAYHSGIWHLWTYFGHIGHIGHIASKREKRVMDEVMMTSSI